MKNKKLLEIDDYLSIPTNFDFLKLIDTDNALDLRDEPEFDKQWMDTFNSLKNYSFTGDEIKFIDMLREKAFKLSFKALDNFELSSQISDDIEIIAKSYVVGKSDNWAITHLWNKYKSNCFPI